MCRNIRPLYNFEPPASEDEIRAAALQYVRKVSGFNKPSKANEEAFNTAVEEVTGPVYEKRDAATWATVESWTLQHRETSTTSTPRRARWSRGHVRWRRGRHRQGYCRNSARR